MYALGTKSESNLQGVDPTLVRCVRRAITSTKQDFSVFEGVRSHERQKALFEAGASRTLNSYHLTGHAVDLVPYVAGTLRWQTALCIRVAVAMRDAARQFNARLTWGAVWDRELLALDPADLAGEIEDYEARFRLRNPKRHPLLDAAHFEIERP